MSKSVRATGILLAVLLFTFSHSALSRSGLGAQLPGAQQQRAADAELQRQQKARQLKALEEKKQRSKDCAEGNSVDRPLVNVPDSMKTESQTSSDPVERDCEPETSNKH